MNIDRATLLRLRNDELGRTDQCVIVPPDRPDGHAAAAPWIPYRQALRELGHHGRVEDIIAAWPPRPDGSDMIARIRAALSSQTTGK
jgi:hypothetical protein